MIASRAPQRTYSLVQYAAPTLAVAALLEFVFLRNFSRMGVFLPNEYWVTLAYDSLVTFGSVMLNFASILVVFLSLLMAGRISKDSSANPRLGLGVSFMLTSLALSNILFLFAAPSQLGSLAYVLLSVGAVVVIFLTAFQGTNPLGKITALLVMVSMMASYFLQVQPLLVRGSTMNSNSPLVLLVYGAGELLALMVPIPVLVMDRRRLSETRPVRAVLIVLGACGTLALAYVGNSWLVSIISMWTLGFTLFLPFPIYLMALGGALLLIATNLRSHPELAYGLLFLLLAGRLMQLTYLNLLGILGFFLVAKYLLVR